eukprot:1113165-Pyramimonas_sp.AAC.1
MTVSLPDEHDAVHGQVVPEHVHLPLRGDPHRVLLQPPVCRPLCAITPQEHINTASTTPQEHPQSGRQSTAEHSRAQQSTAEHSRAQHGVAATKWSLVTPALNHPRSLGVTT